MMRQRIKRFIFSKKNMFFLILALVIMADFFCAHISKAGMSAEAFNSNEKIRIRGTIEDIIAANPVNEDMIKLAGTTDGDWYVFALGRYYKAYDSENVQNGMMEYCNALINHVNEQYVNNPNKLHRNKATEWHRIALTLLACGYNPEKCCSLPDGTLINLIADGTYNCLVGNPWKQGINGAVYALIVLDSFEHTKSGQVSEFKDTLIEYILSRELERGGFSLSGDEADTDVTAMVIQALAPYRDTDTDVSGVINRALEVLKGSLLDDGTYGNAESTAQVILALLSVGVDFTVDESFISASGNNLLDGLFSFYNEQSKMFVHEKNGQDNLMATNQCLYTLVGISRYMDGLAGIYNIGYEETHRPCITEKPMATETPSIIETPITTEKPETTIKPETIIRPETTMRSDTAELHTVITPVIIDNTLDFYNKADTAVTVNNKKPTKDKESTVHRIKLKAVNKPKADSKTELSCNTEKEKVLADSSDSKTTDIGTDDSEHMQTDRSEVAEKLAIRELDITNPVYGKLDNITDEPYIFEITDIDNYDNNIPYEMQVQVKDGEYLFLEADNTELTLIDKVMVNNGKLIYPVKKNGIYVLCKEVYEEKKQDNNYMIIVSILLSAVVIAGGLIMGAYLFKRKKGMMMLLIAMVLVLSACNGNEAVDVKYSIDSVESEYAFRDSESNAGKSNNNCDDNDNPMAENDAAENSTEKIANKEIKDNEADSQTDIEADSKNAHKKITNTVNESGNGKTSDTEKKSVARKSSDAGKTSDVGKSWSTGKSYDTGKKSDTAKASVAKNPAENNVDNDSIASNPADNTTVSSDKEINTSGKPVCNLIIECKSILNNMDKIDKSKEKLVPSDGIILEKYNIEFEQDETAFDVLLRETKAEKIHMEYSYTPVYKSSYIEGIANLYEFDCGESSGWVYSVNDVIPNYGISQYTLNSGDTIKMSYTCDLGKDAGFKAE